MNKPILCLDFDGVIHSYTSGWKGADVIPDPPVPGTAEFIRAALKHFRVAIFSSRSNQPGGLEAMKVWCVQRLPGVGENAKYPGFLDEIEWPTEKPAAFVTIDDRALCFTGTWADFDPAKLLDFKPWNKREFGATGEYPHGKLDQHDEGALKIGIAWDGKAGVVRIDFGKPIAWTAMPREQAVEFAKVIMKKAGAKKIEVEF